MLTGKLGREDLALQGALAKAAGDQDARGVAQNLGDILLVEALAVDQCRASITDRYASGSCVYLPTTAIFTLSA